MKQIIAIVALMIVIANSCAKEIFITPKLTAEEAQKIIEEYVLTKKIELKKYKLMFLSFNYTNGSWMAAYDYKKCPCPIGDNFIVHLNNEEPYEFEFEPGH